MGGGVGEGVQDVLGSLARGSVDASLIVRISLTEVYKGESEKLIWLSV